MMADKCYIKKDDKVKVIAGRDKGKIGKVLKVDRKKGGLLIEKINIVKRHSKPTQTKQTGRDCRKRNADPMVQCHGDVRQMCFSRPCQNAAAGRWKKGSGLCKVRRSTGYIRPFAGGSECHN